MTLMPGAQMTAQVGGGWLAVVCLDIRTVMRMTELWIILVWLRLASQRTEGVMDWREGRGYIEGVVSTQSFRFSHTIQHQILKSVSHFISHSSILIP